MKLYNIEQNIPHKVSEVMCINCKKRFISTRPESVKLKELQCPKCLRQGFIIETGEEIFND